MQKCLADISNFGNPFGKPPANDGMQEKIQGCQKKCAVDGPDGGIGIDQCMEKCMGEKPKDGKPKPKPGRPVGDDGKEKKLQKCNEQCRDDASSGSPDACVDKCMGE